MPGYRVWPLQVRGHFAGPYGSSMRNKTIPLGLLPKDVRKSYNEYEFRSSIAVIESILKKDDSGMITVTTNDLSLT